MVAKREEGGPFRSLSDFARRVDAKTLNKRALESLSKAGAFDALTPNRAQVFHAIDMIIGASSRSTQDEADGITDLFAKGDSGAEPELILPARESWLPMDKLAHEFEAVGFYLSGHPLEEYGKALNRIGTEYYAAFAEKVRALGAGAARLAATVTQKQERRSKAGNRFAFVGFSDPTGQFEAICFADTLIAARDLLEPGKSVVIRVEAEFEGEEVKLRLNGVEALDQAVASVVQGIKIFIRDDKPVESLVKRLPRGGRAPVVVSVINSDGTEIDVSLGQNFTVTPQIRGALKATQGVVEVMDL
jgi:DNA polymerase-3 subunit alpha